MTKKEAEGEQGARVWCSVSLALLSYLIVNIGVMGSKSHKLHGARTKEQKFITGKQNGAVVTVRTGKQFQYSCLTYMRGGTGMMGWIFKEKATY